MKFLLKIAGIAFSFFSLIFLSIGITSLLSKGGGHQLPFLVVPVSLLGFLTGVMVFRLNKIFVFIFGLFGFLAMSACISMAFSGAEKHEFGMLVFSVFCGIPFFLALTGWRSLRE